RRRRRVVDRGGHAIEEDEVDTELLLDRVLRTQVTVTQRDRAHDPAADVVRLVLRRPARTTTGGAMRVAELELVDAGDVEPVLLRDAPRQAEAVVPVAALVRPEERATVVAQERVD